MKYIGFVINFVTPLKKSPMSEAEQTEQQEQSPAPGNKRTDDIMNTIDAIQDSSVKVQAWSQDLDCTRDKTKQQLQGIMQALLQSIDMAFNQIRTEADSTEKTLTALSEKTLVFKAHVHTQEKRDQVWQTKKEEWEEMVETCRSNNAIGFDPVHLNIGGHHYHVSIGTLSQYPGFFQAMCSGAWSLKQSTDDGSIFIDRDGRHYHYIFNYLRNGDSVALPSDALVLKELLIEADYLQLDKLKDMIEKSIPPTSFSTHIGESLNCPSCARSYHSTLSWNADAKYYTCSRCSNKTVVFK